MTQIHETAQSCYFCRQQLDPDSGVSPTTYGKLQVAPNGVMTCLTISGACHLRLLAYIRSGGGGIRTHGGLPHTRSPGVPIRPLSHSSLSISYPTMNTYYPNDICDVDPVSLTAANGSLLSDILSLRSGPARRVSVNRVRVGRQQLSAVFLGCRSKPGRLGSFSYMSLFLVV